MLNRYHFEVHHFRPEDSKIMPDQYYCRAINRHLRRLLSSAALDELILELLKS